MNQFRWPAEWEVQSATWISWPHNRGTWPDRFEPVPSVFARFIAELSRVQSVHVLTGPDGITPAAVDMLLEHPNVHLHRIRTNDVWIRDYGPTFVKRTGDGNLVGIDWHFNAWGGKYKHFRDDAAAAVAVCDIVGCERVESDMTCEGGGLETDGAGTILAASSCFLTETRNPGWSRERIESELVSKLGAEKIIWVDGGGLEGDDTDGHIDQLARFVAPGLVVAAVNSRAEDSNAEGLRVNVKTLRAATDACGRALQVIELPTPAPRLIDDARIPESYCNFLIANKIVIVPTFRSAATDQFALKTLAELMPDREIVPLDAYDLIWGLGAFHCASQQQPA
ncbi:MAG: agmatine deiminase family protein [Pirellulales bacterium]